MGRSSNKYYYFVDGLLLGDLGIKKYLFKRVHALLEQVHTQVLKIGTSDGGIVIDFSKERINLNASHGKVRKSSLYTFTCDTETTKGTLVHAYVHDAVAALEVGGKVLINHTIVKVFSSHQQASNSSSGLHLKNSVCHSQERYIKIPPPKSKIKIYFSSFTFLVCKP